MNNITKMKANSAQKIDFETINYGKWILAGEHSVLRGHPAIIFPVKDKQLTLRYIKTGEEIRAEFSGEYGDEIQFLFWGTLERAIEILDIHHDSIKGKVLIDNNIPVGAGMGASAAICVAVGRLLVHLGLFAEANLLEFSRQLENLFHNESSGADIAVAIARSGIFFSRSGGMHPISMNWQPQWCLSYSDKPSATSRCVKQVKELWQQDPKLAEQIDAAMAESVGLAEQALQSSKDAGLPILSKAIQAGYNCFKRWQLCEGIVDNHIKTLRDAGALAAKPTGAGAGGYVLSLWKKAPPKSLPFELIRL